MSTSRIPILKRNLVDVLKARDAIPASAVTYGWPTGALPNEWICVWDARQAWDQEPAAIQRVTQPREETFVLMVVISVVRPAGSQEQANERAFQFLGELEDALREDHSVMGAVRVAQVSGQSFEERDDGKNCECRLMVGVACEQRI